MQVKEKWVTTVLSFFFIGMGLLFASVMKDFPPPAEDTLGPAYLPKILIVLLIALALVNIVTALKGGEEKIKINHAKSLMIFVGITIFYLLACPRINFFCTVFLFLFLSFSFLNPKARTILAFGQNVMASGILAVLIYIAFGIVLKVF